MTSRGSEQLWRILALLALVFAAGKPSAAEPTPAAQAMRILHANCFSCHNEEKQKGGLQLTSRELVLRGGDNGAVLDLKDPDESPLIKALAPDADPHMPPKKQLSTNQIAALREWVASGAAWDLEALAQASAPRVVQFESIPADYHPAFAIALSPDGQRLAIGRGGEVWIHDLAATNFPTVAKLAGHRDTVRSLGWNLDGTLLASGSHGEVRVWEVASGKLKWSSPSNAVSRASALAFSPLGGVLVMADSSPAEEGRVRTFDAESGREIHSWLAHDDSIYSLGMSPHGGLLATAGNDRLVKLWEVASGREAGQIEGHLGAVLGLAFNTNASELVTASGDKQLKLWDVKSGESVVTIGPRKVGFSAVAWSANSATVVAGTDDGRVLRFTDFKRHTGAQSSETARERQLHEHSMPIQSVGISQDGDKIVAGAADGMVFLLNGEGKLLHKFEMEPVKNPAREERVAKVPSFVRDVVPMLSKAGCMAGSCHAKPEGQNGFSLSVFNYDTQSDYREMVQEAHGRRVLPAAPEESLILLKPSMALEHGGGMRLERGSPGYQMLVDWIRGGMPYQHPGEPNLVRISASPSSGTYKKEATVALQITAHYSDGSERDVTALADYLSNEKEIADVDDAGRVKVGAIGGESVIVARYMGFVDTSRITVPAGTALPEERYAALPVNNFIDRLAYKHFRTLGTFPSGEASDPEFIRRSTLDAIGRLPTVEETRAFLADRSPGKRREWIEHLLSHPAYADYWASKWADLLRSNPDRVGVKSIYFMDQWLRESFRENKPFDQFVREIITAEGSNHENGPLSIYRDRREPPELTTIFSQLFIGVRMECAKCHHHPTEKWSQEDFYQLAAYFGPVHQKGAGLSPPISAGTETFYFAAGGAVKHPVTGEVMQPRPLDAGDYKLPEGIDPRESLADWITAPENPFFARAAVNRVWGSYFGRGLVDPVDDFRVSNPASDEELLTALAEDFAKHGYDLKHLMRTIMNSRLYQLRSEPNEHNLADTKNFSRSYRRRLSAEVLLDAVNDVTGTEEDFNGCPPGTRAVQTWSYKVRSHFMDAFGRPNPSTDAPCERESRSSVVQALHMMNSRALQEKLSSPTGRVKKLADSEASPAELVTELYLAAFSRFPTKSEIETATAQFPADGSNRQATTEDILWALLNSPEFVFNH